MTDKKRLDYLDQMLQNSGYTKRVILRRSTQGRGFRLHETSREGSFKTVREAIDKYIMDNL